MRVMQINPVEVKSFGKLCGKGCKNKIFVGKCNDGSNIFANIIFPAIHVKRNEALTKVLLKMHCRKIYGSFHDVDVYINSEQVSTMVSRPGDYEWDVTELIKQGSKLWIYAKNCADSCGYAEFGAPKDAPCPFLELTVEELYPDGCGNEINIVKEYLSKEIPQYSGWMNCGLLDKYYYFVRNSGEEPVELSVEISPDGELPFLDSGPFTLEAGGLTYLPPMRVSRFVRISFQNTAGGGTNLIKTWFQGR